MSVSLLLVTGGLLAVTLLAVAGLLSVSLLLVTGGLLSVGLLVVSLLVAGLLAVLVVRLLSVGLLAGALAVTLLLVGLLVVLGIGAPALVVSGVLSHLGGSLVGCVGGKSLCGRARIRGRGSGRWAGGLRWRAV